MGNGPRPGILFDMDDETNALASFISDVGKHEGTQHIRSNPLTLMIVRDGYLRGRDAFEKAMLGFAVSD